jgi:pyruvate dehydrogenase E2 component (dihydrolipoamide acetyltransferase)
MAGRFKRTKDITSFQAFAAYLWSHPTQPLILGQVNVDMSRALDYVKRYSELHGVKVTVTHLVIAAAAQFLAKHPEMNMKCQGRKFYRREDVDVFNLVHVPGGKDLSGVMLRDCDRLSLADIARNLRSRATEVKDQRHDTYGDGMSLFKGYPTWLTRTMLRVADFYINTLHKDLSRFGIPRDPFGSVIVTSVGMFGVEEAYGPLPTFARVPIFLCVTKVTDRPWVENGTVVARPVMKVGVTLDHRLMDGYKGAQLANHLKQTLSDPIRAFGLTTKVPVGDGVLNGDPMVAVSVS